MGDPSLEALESSNEKKFPNSLQDRKIFFPRPARVKFQNIRSIFLLFVLVFLVMYMSWISELQSDLYVVYLYFASMFIVVLMLYFLYKSMERVQIGITVFGDRIEYPYFYFWKRVLLFHEMFSLERISFRGEVLAIVIGKFDGGMRVIEREKFESFDDFSEFEKIVSRAVKANEEKVSLSKVIVAHTNRFQVHLVQFSFTIILSGILIFLDHFSESEYFSVLELGALTKSTQGNADLYRLTSTFFLHFNLLHLLTNLLSFAVMADPILRLQDTFRFLIILFVSALVGSITSLYLSPHEYVIGASGGIFGLFGAYCVVKFTKYLPGLVSQRSNRMVFAIIGLQIAVEYFVDGIDSYSHVGGFITGALCMALYLNFAKEQSIYKSNVLEKILAVLLSAAYLWGLATFLARVYA